MDSIPLLKRTPLRQHFVRTVIVGALCATTTARATNDGSDRPTISGTPATRATAGSPYAFQPSAHDADGKTLSFSVKNKPAWANFSIATGSLYGVPTSAQGGTYDNIEISVSNGELAAALPAFTITVDGGTTDGLGTGNATLNWFVPTENTNGTSLTDLAGVFIYYGPSASDLTQVIQVSSPSETSYTISNLAAGTWYFAASAYTTEGTESTLSSVVSKSIP